MSNDLKNTSFTCSKKKLPPSDEQINPLFRIQMHDQSGINLQGYFFWAPVNSLKETSQWFLLCYPQSGVSWMARQARNGSFPKSGSSGLQSALNIETVLFICARPRCASYWTTPALLSKMLGLWPRLCIGAARWLSPPPALEPPVVRKHSSWLTHLDMDFFPWCMQLALSICLKKGRH